MRLKQPDLARRDDVMGRQSHCGELFRCWVIRKDADLLPGALQPSKQLRHPRKQTAFQITEWPLFNPFGHERVHPLGRHRCGLGSLSDQNAVEVDDLLGGQTLSDAPVGADDANGIQVTLRCGMKYHVAPHPQAQPALPVERTIHVERHETNVAPIRGCERRHYSRPMYRWPVKSSRAGMST